MSTPTPPLACRPLRGPHACPALSGGLLALLWLAVARPAPATSDEDAKANAICLDCHNTEDLWSKDPLTDRTLHLTIDADAYKLSVHGQMRCRDCHQRGYGYVPHRTPRRRDPFACLTCHQKDHALDRWDIPKIKKEVLASVHQERVGKHFDCHACHNPHTYTPPPRAANAAERIARSNQVCERCHGLDHKRYDKAADASTAHRFLVNPQHHLEKVKCISCHARTEGTLLHQNLDVKESVRDCNACHAKDSPLLQDQFRSPTKKTKSRPGFLNDDVLDHAYVIGATRNVLLDGLSFFLVGFIVIGALAHLLTRGVRKRRKVHTLSFDEASLYPSWVRRWHALLGACFLLLLLSGVSLHYAGSQVPTLPFRFSVLLHDVTGILCLLSVLFFWVQNALSGNARHYIPKRGSFLRDFIRQVRFYAVGVFVGQKPPFHPTPEQKLNAGQQLTYLVVMYLLLPAEAVTGVLLLFPELAPIAVLGAGGVWPVAIAHLGVAFLLTLFLIIHLYLSTTGNTPTQLFKMMSPWAQEKDASAKTPEPPAKAP